MSEIEHYRGPLNNSKSGSMFPMQFCSYEAKLSNLNLKTRPEQLLGNLLIDIAFPGITHHSCCVCVCMCV